MQVRAGGLEAARRLFPVMNRSCMIEVWCDAVVRGDLDVVRFMSEEGGKEVIEDWLPHMYGVTVMIDTGNMEMLEYFLDQKWVEWEHSSYVLNEERLIWLVERGYWRMAMWFARWYVGQREVRWDESGHELALQMCKFRTSLWVFLERLDIPEDLMRVIDAFFF